MESTFLWGALFGLGVRFGTCKTLRIPALHKPWQIPFTMLYSGVFFSFFDWTRRVCLEDLCLQEERMEQQCRYSAMNQLSAGSESYGDFKKEFLEIVVDEHHY